MKKFRKIMAILVAAVMIVAMAVPAWAAVTDQGTNAFVITVSNAKYGETYTAYKIFDETEAANLGSVYVKVPLSEIKKEQNEDVKYYKVTGGSPSANGLVVVGGTEQEITLENRGTAVDPVYEKVQSPVAYTIESDSIWYNTVANYKTTAAGDKGLILTPTSLTPANAGQTVYLVTFDDKFSASDFAATLKDKVDNANDSTPTTPTRTELNAGYAAKSTPNGSNGIGTNSTTATLNVGAADGDGTQKRGSGYYFVDTTTGAFCALDTAIAVVTVYEKNSVPKVEKEVFNSEGNAWDDFDNAQINDTVYFKLKVTDGKGTDADIIVYDAMEAGLTLNTSSIEVYVPYKATPVAGDKPNVYTFGATDKSPVAIGDANIDSSVTYYKKVTAGADTYALDYTTGQKAQDSTRSEVDITFKLTFAADYVLNNMGTDDEAYIFFNAKLDKDAEMAEQSNDNDAFLKYSAQITAKDTVKVYTHQFDLVKDNKSQEPLAGAEFELYRGDPWDYTAVTGGHVKDSDTVKVSFTKDGDVYTVYDGTGTEVTSVTSSATKITIKGLDVGDYYLIEKKAPNGYNALTAPIKVNVSQITQAMIDANADAVSIAANLNKTKISYQTGKRNGVNVDYNAATINLRDADITVGSPNKYTSGGVEVINDAGTELPSTGGMGTTVLYIVGGMLVILAGAYLFFSRKRTA